LRPVAAMPGAESIAPKIVKNADVANFVSPAFGQPREMR